MRILDILAPYAYLLAIIPLWVACLFLSIGCLVLARRLRELKLTVANLQAINERQFHGELHKKRSANGGEPRSSDGGDGQTPPRKRPLSVV